MEFLWGAINFIFKRGWVWRLMYAYPVVSPGHHEAFVFTPFAMGKYLKQISRFVCTHQCKNTSKCCGLCWEGVAQRKKKKKKKKKRKELLSLWNRRQINKYSWADKVGRCKPPAVVLQHAGLGMRRRLTLWGCSPQHHHHHHHCHHR